MSAIRSRETLPLALVSSCCVVFFFFNDTATTEIYTLSLHDALPIWIDALHGHVGRAQETVAQRMEVQRVFLGGHVEGAARHQAAGQIADAGVDFQHFVAHVRPQLAY